MRKIILSIRYKNNFSMVSANDNISSIEFTTSFSSIFPLMLLIRYKLLKEKIKWVSKYMYRKA